jgi:uncharacterized protein
MPGRSMHRSFLQSRERIRRPRMKLPRWIFPGLQDRRAQRRREPADMRWQVMNTTRNTVLATCLEVADTSAKRNKGLLGRKALAPGEGLWIVPCESVHTVGMRFPIDLVYLDRNHQIQKIRNSVRPWRISVCLSAHSILELPSGSVRQTQSMPGDTVEFLAAQFAPENSFVTGPGSTRRSDEACAMQQ